MGKEKKVGIDPNALTFLERKKKRRPVYCSEGKRGTFQTLGWAKTSPGGCENSIYIEATRGNPFYFRLQTLIHQEGRKERRRRTSISHTQDTYPKHRTLVFVGRERGGHSAEPAKGGSTIIYPHRKEGEETTIIKGRERGGRRVFPLNSPSLEQGGGGKGSDLYEGGRGQLASPSTNKKERRISCSSSEEEKGEII